MSDISEKVRWGIHVLVLLLIALPVAIPAAAQNTIIEPGSPVTCPPERPVTRWIQSHIGRCTLLACGGKLVCAKDGGSCYRSPASDCNTCTYPLIQECLTQEEIEKATPK